jgi:hypothetical protein
MTPADFFYEAGIGTNRYSASIFFTEVSNRFNLPHFLPFMENCIAVSTF